MTVNRDFGAEYVCWATPLYEFLRQCIASPLEKVVLDCGAGGNDPPLALFYRHGYRTFGLEIAAAPLAEASQFCEKEGMPLNIMRGDMRGIPFAEGSFSFAYSYNAIMFMTKVDITTAMGEIKRVLRPNGLCYVNFMSVDDPDDRPMSDTAPLARLLQSRRWSKHTDNEADVYFDDFEILRKEKRRINKLFEDERLLQVYVDYIARKR